MQINESSLNVKTLAYWNLSRCYNNRVIEKITTEKAFKVIRSLLEVLDPSRPLSVRFMNLRDEIVDGTSKRKHHPTSSVAQLIVRTANPQSTAQSA